MMKTRLIKTLTMMKLITIVNMKLMIKLTKKLTKVRIRLLAPVDDKDD